MSKRSASNGSVIDKKEQTPLPPAFVSPNTGHTRWIYSADLLVFNRHTSQKAFVVKVKSFAWNLFITTGMKLCVLKLLTHRTCARNRVLVATQWGSSIPVVSDQFRLDAGSRRHRGIFSPPLLNVVIPSCFPPILTNFGNKKPC